MTYSLRKLLILVTLLAMMGGFIASGGRFRFSTTDLYKPHHGPVEIPASDDLWTRRKPSDLVFTASVWWRGLTIVSIDSDCEDDIPPYRRWLAITVFNYDLVDTNQ